jgi:hypothetical protein
MYLDTEKGWGKLHEEWGVCMVRRTGKEEEMVPFHTEESMSASPHSLWFSPCCNNSGMFSMNCRQLWGWGRTWYHGRLPRNCLLAPAGEVQKGGHPLCVPMAHCVLMEHFVSACPSAFPRHPCMAHLNNLLPTQCVSSPPCPACVSLSEDGTHTATVRSWLSPALVETAPPLVV